MMIVERQLPRNNRIIRLVSTAAMTASMATPLIAPSTTQRLVAQDGELTVSGSVCAVPDPLLECRR